GATRVEVMGSFTGWEPASLARRGDGWELALAAAPGAHRVVVRVDGGTWRAPLNLPAAGDDFGGTVGLLTVP
ncbi:MAG TPA: glycogen-binding domain-containing protein, partial [Gemmatimonadaceae bacterium]